MNQSKIVYKLGQLIKYIWYVTTYPRYVTTYSRMNVFSLGKNVFLSSTKMANSAGPLQRAHKE